MKFETNRCVECGHVLSTFPYKRHQEWPWDKFIDSSGHISADDPFAFCSDACVFKVLKRIIPEHEESNVFKYPDIHPVIQKHLLNYRTAWYGEGANRTEKDRLKEQQEREEEEQKQRDFEALIQPRPIPDRFQFEHTSILAPSGAGKTTLIQHLVLADLAKPDPPAIVVIDPKGLMVERIARLAIFAKDKNRLVIIDPAARPALNIFAHRAASEQIENQAISDFAYIFSTKHNSLTPKMIVPFNFAVRLMFKIPGANIHTLLDLMDEQPRGQPSRFSEHIAQLDPLSQRFFHVEFFSSNYAETRQQIKTRLYGILGNPAIRDMLSATGRSIDIFDCIQERKVVLINTSMAMLSEDHALLGRYFIAATLNAAFSRSAIPEKQWNAVHLYIDEFPEFADQQKTPEMLRLAREYNLGITLALQNLHDEPFTDGIRNSISTNTSTKYASNPEGVDLGYAARDLRCEQDWLRTRTKTDTHARFACFVRGFVTHPMALDIPFGEIDDEPQMTSSDHVAFRARNRAALVPPAAAPHQPISAAPSSPENVPSPKESDSGAHTEAGKSW